MKKILFILIISVIYVACTGDQPAAKNTGDSTATAEAGTVVTMPYTPDYSSSFIAGKQADALTVLNSYKAWETGDMASMADTYADSVSFNFADGSSFIGTRDSAMAMAKKYREDFSSLKIDMDAWMPLHSTDKNQDWVLDRKSVV